MSNVINLFARSWLADDFPVLIFPLECPRGLGGGIGRHKGLKIPWGLPPCGFDSRPRHQSTGNDGIHRKIKAGILSTRLSTPLGRNEKA